MNLLQTTQLSLDPSFVKRVQEAAVHAAIAVESEIVIEQQTLTMGGTVTGGTFTLTFLGQTTLAIQWNAAAVDVQTALDAISTIGAGGVECTGGPFPGTAVVVNFNGSALTGAQPLLSAVSSLTGTSPTITPSRTTAGTWVLNHVKRAALALKVLDNPPGYGTLMSPGVADNNTVQNDFDPLTLTPLSSTNQNAAITNATAASPIVITTAGPHALVTGMTVTISGVGGIAQANGTFVVTVVNGTSFSLNGTTGTGTYTSGGTWTVPESQIQSDMQFQMNSIFSDYA